MKLNHKTRRLTLMAMFVAMAYIIMAVGRIPISSVSFLKYDPKDIVLAICGFVLGPIPALLATLVVSLIEMVTLSGTGVIGLVMNLLSSASFACVAAVIYQRRHTLRGAVAGLVAGALLMTAMMLLWNYFITPIYMGYPRETVAAMLIPVFLPFNLIKSGLNAAITILVYKSVSRALRRAGLMEAREDAVAPRRESAVGVSIAAGVVLVSCVLAVLVARGIL